MIARRYRSICQFFRSCRGQVVLEASRASGWRGAGRSSEKHILALTRGGAVRAADPLRNTFSPWLGVALCVPPILWETHSRLDYGPVVNVAGHVWKLGIPLLENIQERLKGKNIPLFWGPWNTTIHHLQPQKSIYTFGCSIRWFQTFIFQKCLFRYFHPLQTWVV